MLKDAKLFIEALDRMVIEKGIDSIKVEVVEDSDDCYEANIIKNRIFVIIFMSDEGGCIVTNGDKDTMALYSGLSKNHEDIAKFIVSLFSY